MIARKLSIVALHGCVLLLALAGISPTQPARAEGELRVSKPGTVVPNPFASGAQRPEPIAVESRSAQRGPVTYHNPFPNMSSAPPIDMSMLPGPKSRWRRLEATPLPASAANSAILSTGSTKPLRPNWDELPPVEQMIASGGLNKPAIAAAEADSSDESITTIRFAPESLVQPAWLAEPHEPIRPLPTPIEEPSAGAIAAPDPSDIPLPTATESLPAPPGEIDASPIIAHSEPRATPAGVDLMPLIISDYADSPEGWFAEAQHMAQTAESLEELSAIIELCQRALSHGPPAKLATSMRRLAGWAHNRCGELLVDAGQPGEALRNFQIAVALDPTYSLAIHNRAVTLAQQNDTEGALRDFNRVIELNPGLSVAYRNRAELLASLDRVGEAVRDYTRAIEGLPGDPQLYQARGAAWQRLGDFEQAIADINEAIRLSPDDADAYTQRGNLAAEQGDFENALADLQQAIAIDPLWAEAHRSLAWLHATCPDAHFRDTEKAISAAEQAAQLAGPADCFVLDALAAAQASAGQFEEAVRIQQQAIAAAPPDYAEPLRERLNLYQQGQPYLAAPMDEIRPVSHEAE